MAVDVKIGLMAISGGLLWAYSSFRISIIAFSTKVKIIIFVV